MKKFAIIALAGLSVAASAQVSFNEMMANAPGTDQGAEFFELKSASPSFSLNGLTLVVIEGDGLTVSGVIDQAISLTGQSTGTNGLLLMRDTVAVLSPAPDAGTNVMITDFTPDIENGTNTYLIVAGFTGTVGTDYDVDGDGVLDSTPWTSVVDAFSYRESVPSTGFTYTPAPFPSFPQDPNFTPDAMVVVPSYGMVAMDVLGATPGPFLVDGAEQMKVDGSPSALPATYGLTPGSLNPAFSVVINPTNVTTVAGLHAGGSLASLLNRDNLKYVILNQSSDTVGNVAIVASGAPLAPSSLKLMVETSATRTDLSQFTRVFDNAVMSMEDVDFRTSSQFDQFYEVNLTSPTRFVNGSGEISAELLWIPNQDLVSGDGWTQSIDYFVYSL